MVKAAKIRLMLVDDHAIMRMGLANLLSLDPDLEVVAQADDGAAALELWKLHRPDICLMDIMMDGMDGLESLRQLRRDCPEARVIMLTCSRAPEDVAHALEAGACGYVRKNAQRGDLTRAIRAVFHGEQVVPTVAKAKATGDGPVHESGLSARELEVLSFIRQGFTNKEIGRLAGISERTVRWHVSSLMDKLKASDRAQAVARGFELGLLGVSTPPRR
jgi:DNA-binding NarL/FixJ family response regulator